MIAIRRRGLPPQGTCGPVGGVRMRGNKEQLAGLTVRERWLFLAKVIRKVQRLRKAGLFKTQGEKNRDAYHRKQRAE